MVRGIQSQHIAATVKHFALNNKETNRKDSNSRVSERAARQIYLKTFERIVKEAKPWCIMSSYNIVNDYRASENHEPLNVDGDGNELLLSDILGSDANAVSQQLEQDAERAVLRSAVAALSARERQIMELRFGLTDGVERTQKEAADALGISQSYISRLEKRIIRTLKARLESE